MSGHQLVLALLGGVGGPLVGKRLRADDRQLVAGDGQVRRQLDGGILVGQQLAYGLGQVVEVAQGIVQGAQDDEEPARNEDERGQGQLEGLDKGVGSHVAHRGRPVLVGDGLPDRVLVGKPYGLGPLVCRQARPGIEGLVLGLAVGVAENLVEDLLIIAHGGRRGEYLDDFRLGGVLGHERRGQGEGELELLDGRGRVQGREGLGRARLGGNDVLGLEDLLVRHQGHGSEVVGACVAGTVVGSGGVGCVDARHLFVCVHLGGAAGGARRLGFGPGLLIGCLCNGVALEARGVLADGILHLVDLPLDLIDRARLAGIPFVHQILDPHVEQAVVEHALVDEDAAELGGSVQGAPAGGDVGHIVGHGWHHEGLQGEADQGEGPAEQNEIADENAEHAPLEDAGLLAPKRHGRRCQGRHAACSLRPRRSR